MVHQIMFTTISHVIIHVSLVTAHALVLLLKTSVRSFVSAAQNVSKSRVLTYKLSSLFQCLCWHPVPSAGSVCESCKVSSS